MPKVQDYVEPVVDSGDQTMTNSSVALGEAVNVLLGYETGWVPSSASSSPFFSAPQQGLVRTPLTSADGVLSGKWGYPQITLHDSPESVVSAMYDLEIVPGTNNGADATFGSGALLTRNANRAEALADLKRQFGVDFSVANQGYALVEIRREMQTVIHSTLARGVYKRPKAQAFRGTQLPRAILGLPAAGRVPRLGFTLEGASDVDRYLEFFAQHGTHYVSSITSGDRILQVFTYDTDQWDQLKSDYASNPGALTEPTAYMAFAYYTRPRTPEGFGNAAQIGTITIASQDPAFVQSVASGAWRDDTWAKANSILSPSLGTGPHLDPFDKIVPIRIGLSSLALAMTPDRRIAAWRVFRAAMAAIYSPYVKPAFPGTPFNQVYPASRTGLLTMLATPTINTYAQRFDLGSLELALPEVTKQFSLVSNLLEWNGENGVMLPGSQVALLSGIINVVSPSDGSVPTVTVADDAYGTLLMSCGAFLGALFLADSSGTRAQLIADGIKYKRGPVDGNGRYTTVTDGDVFGAPAIEQLRPLATSLSASVVASSALVDAWQGTAPAAGLQTVVNFLEWVAGLIPPGLTDDALTPIRVDALYLARAGSTLAANAARQVPYLTYSAYQPAVQALSALTTQISATISNYQDQIQQRKIAEALIKDMEKINQNVVDTGNLLMEYVEACAQHQQDLANSYGDIVENDKQTVARNGQLIGTLQAQVDDQRRIVANAIDAYVRAIHGAQVSAIVTLSFDIAKSIFLLGFSLAEGVPDDDDSKALAQLVDDIQKSFDVVAAVEKLAEAIGNGGWANADSAFSSLDPGTPFILSSLEWDEFRTRMKNALSQGPALPEQQDVLAEVDILVLRGQALIELQTSTTTLLGAIYQEQRREAIESDQSTRLQNLRQLLHPANIQNLDLGNIDLVGMTGELDQLQSQMMVQLVRAVVIQDLALQYEFMQRPTPPPSGFDLISVGMYIVTQQNALNQAKEALVPLPSVIQEAVGYVITGVPVAALAGGGAFRFQIPISAKEFQPYTMVRIATMDVLVDGVRSTTGGQFEARLLFRGQPFYDLNQQHQALEFSTEPRLTNFLGRVATSGPSTASSGAPASSDISMFTPFSDWEISLPVSTVNEGMAFTGSTVSFTVSFHLVAQINPPATQLRAMARLDAPQPGGDLDTMLAAMQGRSCLMGWDAVFSYTEEKVNDFLAAEYAILKADDEGHLVIPRRTDTTPPDPVTGNATSTTWSMILGAPRVQFQPGNSQTAIVYLDILAATYENDLILKSGEKVPVSILGSLPSGASIRGLVNLTTAAGSVSTQHAVIVDLPSGAWESTDLFTGDPFFNAFLTQQLETCATSYTLGTLDCGTNPTLPALTPTSFEFSVLTTATGRTLLQLFIVTDGTAPAQMSMNHVPEPVPFGSDCSLIISSRVLFQHVVPSSFTQGGSFLQMTGTSPSDSDSSWTATAISGAISVPVDLGDQGDGEGHVRISGSAASVNMAGLTVAAGSSPTYDMALSFNGSFNQPFQEYVCSEGHYQGMCLGGQWNGDSVDVTTHLSTALPIAVTGSGQEQEIQITISGTSVQADGDIASGPCSGGDLQSVIVDAYRTAAGNTIPGAVSVKFPALSFFALKNLLFPASNMVTMSEETYAPGDVVILGTFVQTK